MTEQSQQSITIDAEPAAVMAAIADFASYPSWAAAVKSARVVQTGPDGRARRVAFTLDAGVLHENYELEYVWDADARVDWHLVRGQLMRGQQGSYRLEACDGGTLVSYSLTVDLAIPMLGTLKRKGERIVMDTALKELKKYVEARGPGA
ncbi:MAG: SRPBCC family protein [Jatrophihabitans sp.]|nr:MAG: SRPBCC family protein [Jatrophihabitans sp.]